MARLLRVVRFGRRGSTLGLLWLISLVLLAPVGQAARDVELRWIAPAGNTVDGYKVYLALQPGAYQPALDIGSRAPDPNGIASATIHIGSDVDYYASMTAYNSAGESLKSNEILLPGPQCDIASCDDGNPCTLDACGANGCTHAPLSGSTCNDGDPGTIGDVCSAGICQGVVPQCTADSDCNDGSYCNGIESCDVGTGQCLGGVGPCVDPAHCDEAANLCLECLSDADCPDRDADFCNGGSVCAAGACVAGPEPCVDPAHCSEALDSCLGCVADAECDDGVSCTDDACLAGACDNTSSCAPGEQCDSGLDLCVVGEPRVSDGLVVLYTFEEGAGSTVQDVSGNGAPLDLTIQTPGAVDWLPGRGLEVTSSAVITSSGAASKVTHATQASGEITVEAWITPANPIQLGPARMVALSENPDSGGSNFALCQSSDRYAMRFRTTNTGAFGKPALEGPQNLGTALTHVVFTRDASGATSLYVDGNRVGTGNPGSSLASWDAGHALTLANEPTGDRPWLGNLFLVAIYDRDLSQAEITKNFDAGLSEPVPAPVCTMDADCDDGNPCTLDACGATGCTHAPLSGSTCNDGDPGTIGDVCSAGICWGVVPECTANTECSDQDACNGTERCIDNSCVAGVPLICPAPSQCTVGICQAGACGSTPVVDGLACNDGNSSTTADRCQSGICIGQQSPPPDPDPLPNPDPDPVPDPDPLPDPTPVGASLRPVILEALGTMAVLSVVGDSGFTAQAVVVPPTAAAVPLDAGLKVFNPTASVGMCEPDFCLATLLETDARGKVTGAGSIELGTETIHATFKGRLKGKNGFSQVTQLVKLKGIIQGVEVKGSSKLRGDLDWNTGMFKFEAKVKVCTSGSACEEMTVVDAIALDPNDGLWTLELDVVGVDATTVGGSAFATLGDGRTLVYAIKGKYSSKTDRWNLTLKGTGDDAGSSIKLKDVDLSGGKIQSGRITHKILGHRGVFEPTP
jgi:hypothetical protein